jgi:DNA-binding transcriptional MerR regulator
MDSIQKALAKVPDKTYYRIGEVARYTGLKAYVLRFWETEFKVMMPPKSRSKQRMYRRKDIETILTIKQLLYKERFTIEGARRRLLEMSRQGRDPESRVDVGRQDLVGIRQELSELRELLAAN